MPAVAGYAACDALYERRQRFQIEGEYGTQYYNDAGSFEEGLQAFGIGTPVSVTISSFPSAEDGCSDFQVWLLNCQRDIWHEIM